MHPGRGADQEANGASDGDATATATGSAVNDGNVVEAAGRLPAPLQRRDRERYAIVAVHGRGGLGRVFRAHDQELGRDVAIKELINRSHGAELRFFREALITARLEHPGIVAVHEAGHWADGTPFYAMKLVAGRPLSTEIAECRDERGRRALVGRMVAVADAIAYAHDRRIIHRDLKPSNIICGEFGETIVIDWGLAKDLTETAAEPAPDLPYRMAASTELTVAGSVMGTPAYMAPEQARGEEVDERADVYAIGAILREISGPASTDLDPDLAAIIARATSADRAARYRTARELARDLHAYVNGRRVSARDYTTAAAVAHWIRHHRAITAMAAISLCVVAAVASFSIARVLAARDRAEHERGRAVDALEQARKDRNKALISQASVVMDRDPTAAWKTLDDNDLIDDAPLLAARVRGAGVAWRSLTPNTKKILALVVFDDAKRIAIAGGDRTLRFLDIATGATEVIDRDITSPTPLVATGSNVAYVKRTKSGFAIMVASPSAPPRSVVQLETSPWRIALDDASIFWLDADAKAWAADVHDGATRLLAESVHGFAPFDHRVIVCLRSGTLVLLDQTSRRAAPFPVSTCDGSVGSPKAEGPTIVVPTTPTTLTVIEGARVTHLPIDLRGPVAGYRLSASGAVAAINADGDGVIRAPGSDQIETLPFKSPPQVLHAEGSIVTWGFADGRVVGVDTATNETWNIQAHPEGTRWVAVLPGGTDAVTTGNAEVRFWRLDRGRPRQLAISDAVVMNIAVGTDGSMVLDGMNGRAQVLDAQDRLLPLHEHRGLAWGAAWCGPRACTGSWDATVRCSVPGNPGDQLERTSAAPIRWIESIGDDCVYADATGRVSGVVRGGSLFETPGEPRRVRSDRDHRWIAASDLAGKVSVFELGGDGPARVIEAHDGAVTDAIWIDDRIVSAGADGKVRLWTATLDPLWTVDLAAPVGFLDGRGDTIIAVTDDHQLIRLSVTRKSLSKTPLDGEVAALAMSPSGRHVAVALTAGEVLLLDAATDSLTSHRLDPDGVTCLSFRSEHELVACSRFGGVFSIATVSGTR
jgi:WD40 repeat protein